ncbi:MAG: hypothetical protein FWG14_13955, partial [Peptococcaceae bacterium]|nr:hypothetical protein [Peptococcaceae bacterium]
MNEAHNKKEKQEKIYWHEAFYEALQLELYEYKDILKFENEHQLSKEALKMDVLIIKKEKEVRIDKNFGHIFRTHNIFEYKSETDTLTVADYHKVLGYALLYAAFEQVSIEDITISFALTRHPRDLLKYLETVRKLTVEDMGNGLSYITGDIIPIQLLERSRLSQEDNVFLRNLSSHLSTRDILNTLSAYRDRNPLNEKNVYLNRIIEANTVIFEEVINMGTTAMEIFLEEAEKNGWLDGIKRKASTIALETKQLELAKKMLLDDEPIEKIARWTELSLDTIKDLQTKL